MIGGSADVVIREIITGDFGVQSAVLVTEIFVGKGLTVIFEMTEREKLPSVFVSDQRDARVLGGGEDDQFLVLFHVVAGNVGIAGMGTPVKIIEPPHERMKRGSDAVTVHARKFLRQGVLVDAEMVVKPRLCAPADMQGGVDIALAPLHDLTKLLPIIDIFISEFFHGRTGDDHAVVAVVSDLVKYLVKIKQMVGRSVFCTYFLA